VAKARDVRRQGGKVMRGRPTAHAAPPTAPANGAGSTVRAAPVALRLPPMGGGLPGKGRGSAVVTPPRANPAAAASPMPTSVFSTVTGIPSQRPASHGTPSLFCTDHQRSVRGSALHTCASP
jgi:hypothetical protein